MSEDFFEMVTKNARKKDSAVCVGLDPDPDRVPDGLDVFEFNKSIIDATLETAVCYKPNAAFYEALREWDALLDTLEYAESKGVPTLVDAKRGDIGHTSERYASILDYAGGVTVNPYLGKDAIEPFLERSDKGIFILSKTSNPGSEDFQNLECGGKPLYLRVAEKALGWDENSNIGLVVGATHPEEMIEARKHAESLPFLIPGIGSQGGEVEVAVEHGLDSERPGIINSTRSIIYAHEDNDKDFDEAAKEAAEELREKINEYR